MCLKLPSWLDFKVTRENKKRFVETLLIVMSILIAFSNNKVTSSSSLIFITLAVIYYGRLIAEHNKLKPINKLYTFFMSTLFSGTLSGNLIITIFSNQNLWAIYIILFWIYYIVITIFIYKILSARET